MQSREQSRPASASAIAVVPINGNIGAEIRGADLRRPLDRAAFETIHHAFVRHEVLVFRDQDITLEQQMDFGRLFGELSIHPFSPNLDDKPEVIVLDNGADNPPALTDIWHADETYREAPPMATILRARVVPDVGGDTLFASMSAAYRGLSERMKQYIHGLTARHDIKPFRTLFTQSETHRRKLSEIEAKFPNPWHPVVRVHPVTGRRVLYVNPQFTLQLRDLKEDESQTLLQFLYRQAHIPEYQLRVRWQPDMVVMWDNRSVQHYAAHDYYPQRRTMERVTICGDEPIGVDGPYTVEPGATALPDGHGMARPPASGKRPVRQFERD
jgi:taurine dioxygenase